MKHSIKSIRPFIGSENFSESRQFYQDLGFEEKPLIPGFSVFSSGNFAFYLQDSYVKEWIDNTQIFVEVEDVTALWENLVTLDLPSRYSKVRLKPVREWDWGRECYVHDPSGILWHFGEFDQ